jgi:hypothetical protein
MRGPASCVQRYPIDAHLSPRPWTSSRVVLVAAKLPPRRIDAMFRRLAIEGIAPSYP